MLLFSLWANVTQNFWMQDAQGNSVLTQDEEPHADDSFEQPALISHALPAMGLLHQSVYLQQRPQPVLATCFPPPDRPPAEPV